MSNAIEDPRVRAAIEHYLLDLESNQPRNTRRSYVPKQEEWKRWCHVSWPAIPKVWPAPVPQGQQLPGDLVDEGKLLLFMKDVVVSRPPRKGKRVTDEKKRHLESQEVKRAVKRRKMHPDTIFVDGGGSEYESDSDVESFESTLRLQYNTVRGYVSAIQKLYDEQKSRGVNPAARPQDVALKALKRSILATTWARKRKEYTDSGVGTLRDVYAPAQIPDHTNVAWSERKEIACALRTQRGLKVPGCTMKALVVVMNCGKTNQHGRMEYGSALRHRDPRSCLVGALAFWFFWRWQVERTEKFPVFQRSEDWYDTKVLRRSAKEPQAQLSSQTAREWTSRFYRKAGIKVSKVSHAPRVAATQNADIAGVDEGQIRRAGRWNNGDQMTGCYLTSLPFEFMRAVADFDPEWSGSYFVPKGAVRPPVVFLVQVWPQLDKWKEAHSSPLSDFGVEQNMAAGAFLELMEWLREVLLQDAVFLRESCPDHPLFQDPVFACPEFAAFASKVRKTRAIGRKKAREPLEGRSRFVREVGRPRVDDLHRRIQSRPRYGDSTDASLALQERRRAAGEAITFTAGSRPVARPKGYLKKKREKHMQ
ncbi:hypothetical protein HIM_12477 [Hirsutella minnesotensis 3608]|uniref:Ndc10 domain-containing protein n=1 Tax=Hirsutella minnesotensis 3608 TaxID=1043627 RepID=A0A0F7ZW05_9HYPO|nr:hypothetical protein HIM_12477 [Hirsutella minnesotensis 3608]